MGIFDNGLQIGRSALETYQAALQSVGNNIANAGNADYTRQTVGLSAAHGSPVAGGLQPGAGVAMTELKRNLDEALENRLRAAIGDTTGAQTAQESFARVEALFNELDGSGVSAKLSEFFNGFADLQNNPTDLAVRELVLANGRSVANSLVELRGELLSLGEDLDAQVAGLVEEADRLGGQVAELNSEIVAAEAGSRGTAHSLRDQRDALLRDLSELMNVSVRHQPDGTVYVYVGSEAIVLGGVFRGLEAAQSVDGQFERTTVRFRDTGSEAPIRGGRLGGLLESRDNQAYGRLDAVDQFAKDLMGEVNRVHADGQGLRGFTSLTGSNSVLDPSAALNSAEAGLPLSIENGTFHIAVRDLATGTSVAYAIEVDLDGIGDDTTLASLTDQVNENAEGVSASLTDDNRLVLEADVGLEFTFGHDGSVQRPDSSGVLAALGMNTFFAGRSAANIAVNETLQSSPDLLAAAAVNLPGDGVNAGRLAAVAETASSALQGRSVTQAFHSMVNDVSATGAAALDLVENSTAVLTALQTQKEAISGVSLDEETIELLKFERAYQGAARYMTTIDRLMNELIALIQ